MNGLMENGGEVEGELRSDSERTLKMKRRAGEREAIGRSVVWEGVAKKQNGLKESG